MTSKTSLINTFKTRLSHNMWSFLATFALFFFTNTLIILLTSFNSEVRDKYYSLQSTFDTMLYVDIYIGILCAIFISVGAFRYINSKSEVDLYNCLPIKRADLFKINFSVGIVNFLGGFLINFFVSLLVIIASVGMLEIESLQNIFSSMLIVIVSFISFYAVSVFACVITGNIFMSICTTIGFSIYFITISETIFGLIMTNSLYTYGLGNKYFTNITTPLLNVFNYNTSENIGITVLYFLPTIIIYSVLAFILYKKRPAENSSTPVAINIFKIIIKFMGVTGAMFLGGMIINSMFNYSHIDYYDFNFAIGAVFFGIIFHIAFEMLFELDFKAGFKNLHHFIMITLVVLGIHGAIETGIFNLDTYIPPKEIITNLTFNNVEIKDKETISDILEFMETESKNNNDNYDEVMAYDSFSYHSPNINIDMIGGFSYSLSYYNTFAYTEEIAEKIELSKGYIDEAYGYNFDISKANEYSYQIENTHNEISVEDFEQVFNLILKDKDKLTQEYLKENIPVAEINIYEKISENNYYKRDVAVYSVHEDAIKYLREELSYDPLPQPPSNDIEEIRIFDSIMRAKDSDSEYEVYITGKDVEKYLKEVIPSYQENYNYKHEYFRYKEVIEVYDNSTNEYLGYIPTEVYNSIS